MKIVYAIVTLVFYPLWIFFNTGESQQAMESCEPIAVIELFSSQGCSSCPPADRLLSKMISDAEKTKKNIFALSFHVDYWDRLGWKDPFSNKKFSERQNDYTRKMDLNSNYTPQMIVNGINEFVGSDEKALAKALTQVLTKKPEVFFKTLELNFDSKNNIIVKYELKGKYEKCKLNFALASIMESTSIKRGENSGHTSINEHVVYQLITKDAQEKGDMTFAVSPVPVKENMLVLAFLQNPGSLEITGAAQVKFNSNTNHNQ